MKKIAFALLSVALTAMIAFAQIVKGDMNDDGEINVLDQNRVNNIILGLSPVEYLKVGETVDNSLVAATWYKPNGESFSLNADGTTDYVGATEFKYFPGLHCILLQDDQGIVVALLNVVSLSEGEMVVSPLGASEQVKLTTAKPVVDAHEYVDLGLPSGTLWATCNVGADKPEDYGKYFAWGETVGYTKGESHTFNYANYKWMTPGQSSWQYVTKYTTADGQKSGCWYNGDTYVGTTVNGVIYKDLRKLLPEDDAATANWGSGWCMPTLAQIEELYNSSFTTTEWVTVNGVGGRKVTSKRNGKSIFLPAAGYRGGTSLYGEGSYGRYWSSELCADNSIYACDLYFDSGIIDWYDYNRCGGRSVRAVRVASE